MSSPDYTNGVPRSVVEKRRAEAGLLLPAGHRFACTTCPWVSVVKLGDSRCGERGCPGAFVPILEDEQEAEPAPEVRVGQVWRDKTRGEEYTVIEIDGDDHPSPTLTLRSTQRRWMTSLAVPSLPDVFTFVSDPQEPADPVPTPEPEAEFIEFQNGSKIKTGPVEGERIISTQFDCYVPGDIDEPVTPLEDDQLLAALRDSADYPRLLALVEELRGRLREIAALSTEKREQEGDHV